MSNSWTPGAVDALRQQHNLPFVRTDAQGQVVDFNERFRLIYGWDDRLVGQTIGMILPASFRELHHAGFSRFNSRRPPSWSIIPLSWRRFVVMELRFVVNISLLLNAVMLVDGALRQR